jgi:hypothetical protein
MPRRRLFACMLLIGLVGCTDGAHDDADTAAAARPAPDAGQAAPPREVLDDTRMPPASTSSAEPCALLTFLRRQGGTLAGVDERTLAGVRTLRLDADFSSDELALLAGLPNLREVMIWRDGEGPAGSEGRAAPTDSDLRVLSTLTQLQTLRLGGWSAPLSDEGVAHLAQLPALTRLDLIQVQGITDAAMRSVARIPALASLDLTYTKISDQGLAHLLASTSLKSVRYGWAGETQSWLAAFRRDHPDASFSIE